MGIFIEGIDLPKDGEVLIIKICSDGTVSFYPSMECEKIATAVGVSIVDDR